MWVVKKAASDEHSHQKALCGLVGLRVPWLRTWLCSGTGRWRWWHDWRGGWGELDRQQADLWAHRRAQEGGSGAVCCLLGNPVWGSQVDDVGCTCVWVEGPGLRHLAGFVSALNFWESLGKLRRWEVCIFRPGNHGKSSNFGEGLGKFGNFVVNRWDSLLKGMPMEK